MKTDLTSMTLPEMGQYFEQIGEKKFRAKQVFAWLYRGAANFDEMTDLSKDLRQKLEELAEIKKLVIERVQVSKTDGTKKYLFGLSDGNLIECVFMKYKYGNTICISSQAGCRMGCQFCASAIQGLARDLTPSEMTGQILAVEKDTKEKISNVVVMGTGEPFDNYDNLAKFIDIIHTKEGLNIGLRSITVSTCGLIPKIKEFGEDYPQVNLAISLHAPSNKLRSSMMPINRKYPMETLLQACREHAEKTGRRVTFEYALVKNVNDSEKDAEELALKLKGINCHVNLIPLNKVTEREFHGTSRQDAERFQYMLEKKGIQATIRRELGSDIDAACGQLRLKNNG
ncbi:23S rRNA (adenine(2503)-C(2))-methyltransferase RlmN [Sinanaerobacter chloroacetimidivorans]|uniref:Probable dual-specificity RNA methyltransferase RlmN n=1 Tax=Sinanaerobacter chloroacetimidivorans TaxID=2818044 RepID=A0A8J8B454_9FIRM|nr:23S rRNA (adenine(2503)-C(2))-methyltransferase RlmN [Sinanaerobacter chloroacetimidivorans]MBR0598990.1 23S rRNA (adenine(2503)-C(2))-methyltransferase RlmN [Sinanaerobacter chloroacetimidivorans]